MLDTDTKRRIDTARDILVGKVPDPKSQVGTNTPSLPMASRNSNTDNTSKPSTANIGFEAKLVDCMVALPGQLFYSTQIPVCLWFLSRDKSGRPPSTRPFGHPSPSGRRDGDEGRLPDRRGETLFIDARKLGTLIDRVHRELTEADLEKITSTYHAWKSENGRVKSEI